jgi:glycosyltransferase involved in cell wall biosynthesis
VAFWHEVNEPINREQIALPDGVPGWCVSDLGNERALAALRNWQPEVIYAHGLLNPKLEAETLKIVPAVFFAHSYYGTCISGGKTFKNPVVTPCSRRFGWQCLVHYYPHRCGGWSPVTMLREYRRQSRRLELLSGYRAVVTHSDHMRSEYIKHGLAPDRVYKLSYSAYNAGNSFDLVKEFRAPSTLDGSLTTTRNTPHWRLLFLGRMDFLKGGGVFIDALEKVRVSLDLPLRATFAGDGPERGVWERQAKRVQARSQGVDIEFVGWMNGHQLESLWANYDLLVVPSLWPEPFGQVGIEAGSRGVPAAAFAVGGIPDWLTDGVNGHLAPGDPPTAAGLAAAIIRCLRDPDAHARLSRGALEMAQRFNTRSHLAALLEVFGEVVRCE